MFAAHAETSCAGRPKRSSVKMTPGLTATSCAFKKTFVPSVTDCSASNPSAPSKRPSFKQSRLINDSCCSRMTFSISDRSSNCTRSFFESSAVSKSAAAIVSVDSLTIARRIGAGLFWAHKRNPSAAQNVSARIFFIKLGFA